MGTCHSCCDLLSSNLFHQEASQRIDIVTEYWAGLKELHPFTEAAVAKCNGKGRSPMAVVFEGAVVDCTKWQHEHPGGAFSISMNAGDDATRYFLQAHNTPSARAKAAELTVGRVYTHPSEVPAEFNSAAESVFQVNRWISKEAATDVPTAFGPVGSVAAFVPPQPTAKTTEPAGSNGHAAFVDVPVRANVPVGSRTRRLTLDLSDVKGDGWSLSPGGHISVAVEGDSITRPYSPVGPSDSPTKELTIFVKRYDGGKGSTYVTAKRPGDTLRLRGPMEPVVSIKSWVRGAPDAVLVAGGTGAAPILTMARWCKAQPASVVRRLTVFACFRDREDAMLTEELAALHDGDRCVVVFVYSQDPEAAKTPRPPTAPRVVSERLGATVLRDAAGTRVPSAADEGCAVVCGPARMSEALPAVINDALAIPRDKIAVM